MATKQPDEIPDLKMCRDCGVEKFAESVNFAGSKATVCKDCVRRNRAALKALAFEDDHAV